METGKNVLDTPGIRRLPQRVLALKEKARQAREGPSLAAIALLGLSLAGCTINRPLTISCASLGPNEKPIAIVSDHVHAYALFGFTWGDDSLQRAFTEATQSVKADTLVNVFSDKQCWFPLLPFYLDCELNLNGTAVVYAKDGTNAPRYDVDYGSTSPPFLGQVTSLPRQVFIPTGSADVLRECKWNTECDPESACITTPGDRHGHCVRVPKQGTP